MVIDTEVKVKVFTIENRVYQLIYYYVENRCIFQATAAF